MDTKAARAWLSDNGYRIKPKGRIPQELLAIYQAKVLKKRAVHSSDTSSADPEPGTERLSSGKKVKRSSCGFCTVRAPHQHKHCPGSINQGKMGIWVCLCYEKEHTLHVSHL